MPSYGCFGFWVEPSTFRSVYIWVRIPDPWPPPWYGPPSSRSWPPPEWYGPPLGNTGHGTIHACMHARMHPSIHPDASIHPCIHPSIHPDASIHPCIHPSIHTYIHRHTYIPIYLPTYIPTYLRTYVPTYLRTYIHTYLPTHLPTYQHTNIPTYQHTTTTGHRPQGGGTRRTIPPPQATGGGDQKNHTTIPGHRGGGPWGGEGGAWESWVIYMYGGKIRKIRSSQAMHVWKQHCKPCQVMTRGNQRDRDRERAANRNAGRNLNFVTSVLRVCDDLRSFVKIEVFRRTKFSMVQYGSVWSKLSHSWSPVWYQLPKMPSMLVTLSTVVTPRAPTVCCLGDFVFECCWSFALDGSQRMLAGVSSCFSKRWDGPIAKRITLYPSPLSIPSPFHPLYNSIYKFDAQLTLLTSFHPTHYTQWWVSIEPAPPNPLRPTHSTQVTPPMSCHKIL